MRERKEIDEKFYWDLSPLMSNLDFDEILKKIKEFIPKFKEFEEKLNKKETILDFFKLEDKFADFVEPIDLYLYLRRDECLSNDEINEKIEKISQVLNEISVETSFSSSELYDLSDDMLDDIIRDENFKNLRREFEMIKKHKKHKLSKEE